MSYEDGVLSRAKSLLAVSRPVSFSYDRTQKQFAFGAERYEISDMPQYGIVHKVDQDELSLEEVDQLIEREAAVHTFRSPITLPRFHTFIRDEWSDELVEETIDVMAEVMGHEDVPLELRQFSRDHLGFGATRIDTELGRVVLQVPGMCACLGPDATTPMWGSEFWDQKIMDYSYHNIDRPLQRAALTAGLGHLALRAR